VTAALAAKAAQGITLSLGGDLGGVGADYKIWTCNLPASMPF
jgi:hypothetical protein